MRVQEIITETAAGKLDVDFALLYGQSDIQQQSSRYIRLLETYRNHFGGMDEVCVVSTPGRTEVGGNHTDHNAGRVLAAAVSLDTVAVAGKSTNNTVELYSEGYSKIVLDISQLDPVGSEQFSSAALIRGVLARCRALGYLIGGFRACVTSSVLPGSGLSSSAAFEVLIVSIVNYLYNDGHIDAIENAGIAQFAENNYFGKPCGLMDMTACAVGSLVYIDFRSFDIPSVEKVDFDFGKSGHKLIIVNTGGSHADLNEDYAALEHEMKDCAAALGGTVLRDVSLDLLIKSLPKIRGTVSDRAILRAFHFFYDDERVERQKNLLKAGDFEGFKREIIASGYNSFTYCQNCFAAKYPHDQGISVALAVSESLLAHHGGAWRVHGGGFAGTIQCFVPDDYVEEYAGEMARLFGSESVYKILIRPVGTTRVI